MVRIGAARSLAWTAVFAAACMFPVVVTLPYYLSTAIFALIYVTLAVAFDLVVGRIGALSLAQPAFYGYGAYVAALLATHRSPGPGFWVEVVVVLVGAPVLALAIGIPAFRLSLHSFAMGTLGFAMIAQLVANNWMDLTRGPLCISAIAPLRLPYPGGVLQIVTLRQSYYVILAIAILAVLIVGLIAHSRLGVSFRAVRDDPLLAAARGLAPNQLRLIAFTVSASLSALAGAFAAHFVTVVCPSYFDIGITVLLLIMVFTGGGGSLRGVVSAAIIFTVVPELLRIAASWRLVFLGVVLMITVTAFPGGLEHLYARADRVLHGLFSRSARAAEKPGAKP